MSETLTPEQQHGKSELEELSSSNEYLDPDYWVYTFTIAIDLYPEGATQEHAYRLSAALGTKAAQDIEQGSALLGEQKIIETVNTYIGTYSPESALDYVAEQYERDAFLLYQKAKAITLRDAKSETVNMDTLKNNLFDLAERSQKYAQNFRLLKERLYPDHHTTPLS